MLGVACHETPKKKANPVKKSFPAVARTLETTFGEIKTFELPDSTRILQNSHTRIGVLPHFMQSSRELYLDGDAFFSVRPGGDQPLLIRTGMLNLETSGGSFRVSAHGSSRGQSVEVMTGTLRAIKAYPSDFPDTEQLGPGDMVMINRDIDLMEKETYDTASLGAWLTGALIFKNNSLGEVIRRLEEWYDVDISTTGARADTVRSFTGTFERPSLRTLLDTLGKQGKFTYTIKGNRVVIGP